MTARRFALAALLLCSATPACNKTGGNSAASSAKPAASAAPAVVGTKFTIKVPAKGTTAVSKETTNMQFSIAVLAGGKVIAKTDMKQAEEHNKTEQVLAANDKAPTSVRATYDKWVQTETDGKKTKPHKSPIDGKTYLAELKGSEIVVTDANGKKVKKAEAKAVKKDEKDLGKTDPFTKLLPDHPLKKGEQLNVTKAQAAELMGEDDDTKMDVDKVAVTFQGTKEEGGHTVGLFRLELQVTGHPEPTLEMQMKLDGTAAIDTATGWPISMHLAGPINVKGEEPKHHLHMEGEGKMQADATYSYK